MVDNGRVVAKYEEGGKRQVGEEENEKGRGRKWVRTMRMNTQNQTRLYQQRRIAPNRPNSKLYSVRQTDRPTDTLASRLASFGDHFVDEPFNATEEACGKRIT